MNYDPQLHSLISKLNFISMQTNKLYGYILFKINGTAGGRKV